MVCITRKICPFWQIEMVEGGRGRVGPEGWDQLGLYKLFIFPQKHPFLGGGGGGVVEH